MMDRIVSGLSWMALAPRLLMRRAWRPKKNAADASRRSRRQVSHDDRGRRRSWRSPRPQHALAGPRERPGASVIGLTRTSRRRSSWQSSLGRACGGDRTCIR